MSGKFSWHPMALFFPAQAEGVGQQALETPWWGAGDFSWASVPGEVGKAGGVNLPPDFLSLPGTLRKGAFPLSNCFVGIWSLEPSPPQGSAQQTSTPVEFSNMFC